MSIVLFKSIFCVLACRRNITDQCGIHYRHALMFTPSSACSDFPISYEGPHVISQEQVWVGVVTKGCDGVPLNSSYANR